MGERAGDGASVRGAERRTPGSHSATARQASDLSRSADSGSLRCSAPTAPRRTHHLTERQSTRSERVDC
jgi:hypothetical protein